MNPSFPEGSTAKNDADLALQETMQEALQGADPHALDALQGRVLAQWEMRTASAAPVSSGPVTLLRWSLDKRRISMGVLALGVVAIIGLQTLRPGPDPAMEDLLEPDVLSFIALGEL